MFKLVRSNQNYERKHNYKDDSKKVQNKRFNCDSEECKSSFKLKGDFLEHFKNHFVSEDKFTCKMCGKKFGLKKNIRKSLINS